MAMTDEKEGIVFADISECIYCGSGNLCCTVYQYIHVIIVKVNVIFMSVPVLYSHVITLCTHAQHRVKRLVVSVCD